MDEIIILCHGLGGNKNFYHPLEEKLMKINIGLISFDFPYHGERKNKYTTYTVKNCLKTIDNVYKYVLKQYKGIKIDFMGKSLGALYLYSYLQQKNPKINKVIFQCMPLNNKIKMTHDFFNNPKNTDKYFCVGYERKLPKKILDDLEELESNLLDIKCIDIKNILFIHGTEDKVASLSKVKKICNYIASQYSSLSIQKPEEIYRNLLNLNISGLGTVYLLTLVYFISKGESPIYDRFAHQALDALEKGLEPRAKEVPKHTVPDKNSKHAFNWFETQYAKRLKTMFPGYYKERKLDRALWVYGHLFKNSARVRERIV